MGSSISASTLLRLSRTHAIETTVRAIKDPARQRPPKAAVCPPAPVRTPMPISFTCPPLFAALSPVVLFYLSPGCLMTGVIVQ
jgi:hypothetical protein